MKTILFPFSVDDYGLCYDYCKHHQDTVIASFYGTSYIGKDLSYCLNKEDTGIVIHDIYEVIKDANKLIVLENEISKENSKLIEKLVNDYSNCLEIETFIDINVEKRCNIRNIPPMTFNDWDDKNYYYPTIPIIFVSSLIPSKDSEFVIFKLCDYLEKENLCVSCLMKRNNCQLNNCFIIPKEFRNGRYSSEQATFMLNKYIRNIVEKENPDVLVIELNDGMLRYNEELMNTFGIYNYMISEAVKPDYNIVILSSQELDNDFLANLDKYSSRKFDAPIDAIHVTNAIKINSGDFAYNFIGMIANISSDKLFNDYDISSSSILIGSFENDIYVSNVIDKMFNN